MSLSVAERPTRKTRQSSLPHTAAAEWFAEHGFTVEAVRHAQAARRWDLAARLLSERWVGLYLDGRRADGHELLRAFPPDFVTGNAELAMVAVADELTSGSLEEAARHLGIATRALPSVPEERRPRLEVALSTLRLSLARQRNDAEAVANDATRLLLPAETPHAVQAGLDDDLRALSLVSLGIAETLTGHPAAGEPHLQESLTIARRIGRPFLEVGALSYLALAGGARSDAVAEKRSREAIAIAETHGWREEPIATVAYVVLGSLRLWCGRLHEAEEWLALAERAMRTETEPGAGFMLHVARGPLELTRGRYDAALDAFGAATRYGEQLVMPHVIASRARGHLLIAHLRAGQPDAVARAIAGLDDAERDAAEFRVAAAALALERGNPQDAAAVLAPVVDPTVAAEVGPRWRIQALILEAMIQAALGDAGATSRAVEEALDLAEPDGLILPSSHSRLASCSSGTRAPARRTPRCSPRSSRCSPAARPARSRRTSPRWPSR
jgi:LuxR family transcriptional regulator, maltose regulon positive regulatory protein